MAAMWGGIDAWFTPRGNSCSVAAVLGLDFFEGFESRVDGLIPKTGQCRGRIRFAPKICQVRFVIEV